MSSFGRVMADSYESLQIMMNNTHTTFTPHPAAGSRSGSPSSRLSYATYAALGDSGTMGRTRRRSGIPRSTGTSREPSPTRYSALSGISPSKSRSRSISGKCFHQFVSIMYTLLIPLNALPSPSSVLDFLKVNVCLPFPSLPFPPIDRTT